MLIKRPDGVLPCAPKSREAWEKIESLKTKIDICEINVDEANEALNKWYQEHINRRHK